jgi:hypothetical protein
MPPKQTKKQTSDIEKPVDNDAVSSIKEEWSNNVQEILKAREKLALLEKRNEDIISKLWAVMKKNPSEQVIIEAENKDEKKPVKSKKTDTETEEPEVKPVVAVKATKAKATSKKSDVKNEIEAEEEKPSPVKKPISKNTKDVKETKETKDTKLSTPTKGKISAPSKGAAKPKQIEQEEEKPKPSINDDSSSDTEVDSLSSVSSESDASGGEDD